MAYPDLVEQTIDSYRQQVVQLWERVNLAERRTDLHLLQVQELSRTISRLERELAEAKAALSACAPETDYPVENPLAEVQ